MTSLADKYKEFVAAQKSVEPVTSRERILLFDGLNTFLRAFAATPTLGEDGNHVGGVTGFLLSLAATIRMFRPNRCIVVFDGVGGSQRRRALFPDYKAKRRTMTKLNRTYDFASLDDEQRSRMWQLGTLAEILKTLPITTIVQDLVEADDVIAYLAETQTMRGGDTIIVSMDKDFLQLVNEHVSVYSPVVKKMYDAKAIVEDYGFHPHNFVLYRAVTGDESDCIPGVVGVKEKTLLKYAPELALSDKQTVEMLFESITTQLGAKKKIPVSLQSLANSRELVERNLRLMRLDDVAMSGNTRVSTLEKFDKEINLLNKYQLTKLLQSHKLSHAFGDIDKWVMNSFVPLMRHTLSK